MYDPNNIFAKILRGEIPCTKVHETEHTLAFRDIQPLAKSHVLVIPKGAYTAFDEFAANASEAEIADFHRCAAQVCEMEGLEDGFRIIANTRTHGRQDVPHYHLHIIGGEQLGPMYSA